MTIPQTSASAPASTSSSFYNTSFQQQVSQPPSYNPLMMPIIMPPNTPPPRMMALRSVQQPLQKMSSMTSYNANSSPIMLMRDPNNDGGGFGGGGSLPPSAKRMRMDYGSYRRPDVLIMGSCLSHVRVYQCLACRKGFANTEEVLKVGCFDGILNWILLFTVV